MKAIIEKKRLMQALTHLHGVVEKRNTIPILANVLIEAKTNQLILSSTDMDISIIEKMGQDLSVKLPLTEVSKKLYDLLKNEGKEMDDMAGIIQIIEEL